MTHHHPPLLCLGKDPSVPTARQLSWALSESGQFGETKNLLPLLGVIFIAVYLFSVVGITDIHTRDWRSTRMRSPLGL